MVLVENALSVDVKLGMRLEVRRQRVGRVLEAQVARTSNRGADIALWVTDVMVISELRECRRKRSSARPSGLTRVAREAT